MAKNTGKIFEEDFKKSVPEDIFYLRLNDPPSSFGQDSSFVRFSLKNPCDALLHYGGILFCLELKSAGTTSFSFQENKKDKTSKNIKFHQIESLKKMGEYKNNRSGFIFNFRTTNNTYWLPIESFLVFFENPERTKKSINEQDVIGLGGLIIESELKKVHYKYNIEKFLNKTIANGK